MTMRIVVTDSGLIWNHNNLFLKQFKDIVLVVCLEGKQVTEEYKCFVSPYQHVGMEIDEFGVESQRYKALESVASELKRELRYHDKIVFLTPKEEIQIAKDRRKDFIERVMKDENI